MIRYALARVSGFSGYAALFSTAGQDEPSVLLKIYGGAVEKSDNVGARDDHAFLDPTVGICFPPTVRMKDVSIEEVKKRLVIEEAVGGIWMFFRESSQYIYSGQAEDPNGLIAEAEACLAIPGAKERFKQTVKFALRIDRTIRPILLRRCQRLLPRLSSSSSAHKITLWFIKELSKPFSRAR